MSKHEFDPWHGTTVSSPTVVLCDVPTKQLRAWLKKARKDGGAIRPSGWQRDFTVANLTAELARRRGTQS